MTRPPLAPPLAPAPRVAHKAAVAVVMVCGWLTVGCGASTLPQRTDAAGSVPDHAGAAVHRNAVSCDDGVLDACHWLGVWFLVGGAGPDRKAEGRVWLEHACSLGHKRACAVSAGQSNDEGAGPPHPGPFHARLDLPDGAPDTARVQAEFCDTGEMKACNWVGVFYLMGGGGTELRLRGVDYLRTACDRGYDASCRLVEALRQKLQELQDRGEI